MLNLENPSKDGPLARVEGQEGAVGILSAALEGGRAPHAYLFSGPAGVGKRTAARAWAQVLLCQNRPSASSACGECGACKKVQSGGHPDLLWVDFSYQAALLKEPLEKQKSLKISTVRAMEHSLRLKPSEGSVKVAVLHPAEALGMDAGHALLKIVEEPPPGTHLVLITTEAGALLATIRSRCQRVRFRPLALEVVSDLLARRHGDRPMADIERAARGADGSLERAQALLDEGAGLDFDWAGSPLSEVISWCEGFGNPRLGRTAAERFLESLLTRFQTEARAGERSPEDLRLAFHALTRVRQNGAVSLNLLHLLYHLRRGARRKAEV